MTTTTQIDDILNENTKVQDLTNIILDMNQADNETFLPELRKMFTEITNTITKFTYISDDIKIIRYQNKFFRGDDYIKSYTYDVQIKKIGEKIIPALGEGDYDYENCFSTENMDNTKIQINHFNNMRYTVY